MSTDDDVIPVHLYQRHQNAKRIIRGADVGRLSVQNYIYAHHVYERWPSDPYTKQEAMAYLIDLGFIELIGYEMKQSPYSGIKAAGLVIADYHGQKVEPLNTQGWRINDAADLETEMRLDFRSKARHGELWTHMRGLLCRMSSYAYDRPEYAQDYARLMQDRQEYNILSNRLGEAVYPPLVLDDGRPVLPPPPQSQAA